MTTSNPTSNQSQPNNEQRLYKFNDITGMERIEIKELNIQGCYTLKHGGLTNDKCTLCRQLLTSPSFEDMQNGKGDSPRNMSARFHKNYQAINWGRKKTSPKPGKKQIFKYPSPKG